MPMVTYIEAITQALREELRRDASVFLLGEDIGVYGGAFKATKGLHGEFGDERVIDTPISEAAILGAATGAALVGMRPIAEMQFADFVSCGFNQLVMNTAKTHYRWNLPVPMVVRLPSGGGIHGGPFHSANPEAWFYNVPGLKIVAAATAYDAKGLLKSAVRDDNPVLFLEYKSLYRRIKGEVPEEEYLVPLGSGTVCRNGTDAVILTYGPTVHSSLEAAERLASETGGQTRVVDLRSLAPLDEELILQSVRECGKVLIVHEASVTGGVGAEISALIAEKAFPWLDAPVRRVGALNTPVPLAPTLEAAVLPSTTSIHHTLAELIRF